LDIDLRELAIKTVQQLELLADQFPSRSPGNKTLRRAAWGLRVGYIFGTGQKAQIVLIEIGQGTRRISDLVRAIGIKRDEVEGVIDNLLMRGYLFERIESPMGRGRPSRCFFLSERGESWFEAYAAKAFLRSKK
jgi:hypothetical protein